MSEDFREIDEMTNEVIVEDKDVNVTVEDDDDDYELVCMICHRPESKAGKILTMPGNLNICTDCMQKMFNTAEQFGLPEMDGFPGFVTKMEIPIQQMPKNAKLTDSTERRENLPEIHFKTYALSI